MSSFAKDILPLFRQIDIDHMKGKGVLLDDYAYMSDAENAHAVYETLTAQGRPQMPPDAPWDQEKIGAFEAWMEGGREP